MRAVLITIVLFIFLGLVWVCYSPILSYRNVRLLGAKDANRESIEDALLRAQNGAIPALRGGLESGQPGARVQCAYLLAAQHDPAGEEYLLRILREHPNDELGLSAERYLSALWERHDSPSPEILSKIARMNGEGARDLRETSLFNETLLQHPEWLNGYIRRARLYLENNDPYLARRDAVTALLIEPHHFEAMIILSDVYMNLNSPDQAYLCLQQALETNPRLRGRLQEPIRSVLRSLELQRARKRQERHKSMPLA